MTLWYIILWMLLLIPFALLAYEIRKIGLRAWLGDSLKESAFQHMGSYLPRRLRIIGPTLYLLMLFFCFYKVGWLSK